MNKIRFSHQYRKLDGIGEVATLLEVIPVKLSGLHKPFLDYDTDNGKYVFPHNGDYLLLIFFSNGRIFTTIRPHNNNYYANRIGNDFEIEVNQIKEKQNGSK